MYYRMWLKYWNAFIIARNILEKIINFDMHLHDVAYQVYIFR